MLSSRLSLTCRQRKLKCDESRPRCLQCTKANRDCVPSSGIVFRHQQNASMNDAGADSNVSLKGFFAYKNTFDNDSVWVDIPKQRIATILPRICLTNAIKVLFVDNNNPYADEISEGSRAATSPLVNSAETLPQQAPPPSRLSQRDQDAFHGLDMLSTVATRQHLTYTPAGTSRPTTTPVLAGSFHSQSPMSASGVSLPRFDATSATGRPSPNPPPPSTKTMERVLTPSTPAHGNDVGIDFEVAFLLRHFAEVPGQWMDLFDSGNYFAHHVPVKAMTNPLLKYAAIALAAKQLARTQGRKAPVGGAHSRQALMEVFPHADQVDWFYKATHHYDRAISLLMDALRLESQDGNFSGAELEANYPNEDLPQNRNGDRPYTSVRSPSAQEIQQQPLHRKRGVIEALRDTDEKAASAAILCIYEFFHPPGTEWTRHLDGTRSLLDIYEGNMISSPSPLQSRLQPISKARWATFWNFARQDMLSALINETQTRLDTEDLAMWRRAGLHLDRDGLFVPSNATEAGYAEGIGVVRENITCCALIWLLSKIINYLVAADSPPPGSDDRPWVGINQQTIHLRWFELEKELNAWHHGLPDAFHPCAVLEPRDPAASADLPEVWYSMPMCASTMQYYHMAQMLLLMNQPQHSTLGRTTFYRRLGSYKHTASSVVRHGRDIVSISLARPEGGVRAHSVQPLFIAGQCLEGREERREILSLLRGVEKDLGWATEWRVQQLLEFWGEGDGTGGVG